MSKKKASYSSVILAEYRLLNALIKNPDFLEDSRIREDLLIDEVAKSIYEAIVSLNNSNVPVTKTSLLQAGSNIDFNVTDSVVGAIFNIDSEGAETLDDIVDILQVAHKKHEILTRLDSLKASLSEPGAINEEAILKEIRDIDDRLTANTESSLMSFSDWTDKYLEDLEERKIGRKYSFGDPLLDEAIYKGAYPGAITIIAGSTGMGKSAYALSLADNLLENNIPVMYCSLEMSAVDQFDRLIAKRCNIDSAELYKSENIEGIIDRVQEEREYLSERNKFYFCEDPDLSLVKLKSLIKEFKKRTKSDYVLCIVDLLTQVKDFMQSSGNTSTAVSMELAMNKLNALAKAENCHIIGIAQFRRAADQGKIYSVEEIGNLRPQLGDVKNSGGLAERARVLLSVFRPKYYADRYLINDPAAEALDDIMEVQVLKNSSGQSGQIFKYMFEGRTFKLLPLVDEEEEKMNILKNIDY